jgi:hypothetical protein
MGDIAGFAQRPLGDVRFGMHDGLKSDITPCPKSAAANTGNRTVDGCAKERVNDLAVALSVSRRKVNRSSGHELDP